MNGVVKYSATHNQNARLVWMKRSQCSTVVIAIRLANVPTGRNPPATVCHFEERTARKKKYAPPRYTEPRTIGDIVGLICHANNRFVSLGHRNSTTNAKTRKGMIAADTTRVVTRTRSSEARRVVMNSRC